MNLDPFAEVVFTQHALERMAYLLDLGPEDHAAVRGELRSAIFADRIATRTPNWVHSRVKDAPERAGFLYLWDPDATRCWVVAPYKRGRQINVVTVRLGHDERAAHDDSKLVRRGMTRT